jgi:hypothetical protein
MLREGRHLGKGNIEGREARREALWCKEGRCLGKKGVERRREDI